MGFDHVGHHHQPDLPPIVQEIPCRRAGNTLPRRGSRAHWITCGLEEQDKRDTPLLMVTGRYPQDACGDHVLDDRRRRAQKPDPGPRDRGLSRPKAVQAKFNPSL